MLVYFNNRLIRRFENPKLGNLDFLSTKSWNLPIEPVAGTGLFDLNGYIELKSYFKPNLFRTEIENPYYSNFFYASVLAKISGNDINVKRKAAEPLDDELQKKVKVNQ